MGTVSKRVGILRWATRTTALPAIATVIGCGPGRDTNPRITAMVSRAADVVPFSTANPDVVCWPGAVCIYNMDFASGDPTSVGVHWKGTFLAIDDQEDVGPSDYFEYNLRYGVAGDEANWQQLNYGADVHDLALHNLQPDTLYGVIVEGHEGEGSSPWSPGSAEVMFQTKTQGGTVTVEGTNFAPGAAVLLALQAVPDGQGILRSIGPFAATAGADGTLSQRIGYAVCRSSVDISQNKTTVTAADETSVAFDAQPVSRFCGSATDVPDFFGSE